MAVDVEQMTVEPGLTAVEAAQLLGVHPGSVPRLIRNGILPKSQHRQRRGLRRQDVEKVALERWTPGHPYWLGANAAADLLGVTPTRVRQLARADNLPYILHDGRIRFRRPQLEVVAHARIETWHSGHEDIG